jgi:hypothetical protein
MSTTARTPSARVSALRALSVVLAFTAAVGLVFGTAGFTAMEADRGVDVNVTDDENAYLGYEMTTEKETFNNSTEVIATAAYHNRFRHKLTLNVTVKVDGNIHKNDVPITIHEGQKETVEVTAIPRTEPCPPDGVTVRFVATGSASEISVSLERDHHNVMC